MLDVPEFNAALKNGRLIVLSCNCTVSYSGRAESSLDDGDRLIIIKPDRTLLIHQPHGSNPINYMKEGTIHKLAEDGQKLVLSSMNPGLKEFMTVSMAKIHSIQILDLLDPAKIRLMGSEKDMADMIYKNPLLIGPDFRPLSREEHTKYGFIDIFGYDGSNVLVVVECKRQIGDLKAVDQLMRYVTKIKQLRGLDKVRGILAAPKISPNALQMLHDNGFEFRSVNPPKYLEKHARSEKKLSAFMD